MPFKLLILFFVTLVGCSKSSGLKVNSDLKDQINTIYKRAVQECEFFHSGDVNCVKHQFYVLYRWYIIKDEDRVIGHPGILGPEGPK